MQRPPTGQGQRDIMPPPTGRWRKPSHGRTRRIKGGGWHSSPKQCVIAAVHGARGRRLEYSIGWPVDARTRSAIEAAREGDWSPGLTAKGKAEPDAQVLELTGLLRTGPGGDQLSGWPADMRVFGRRTPRTYGEQAQLGQDPNWRYGAFATNTPAGQVQQLDARHRTQAHVEDRIKELKACGGSRLPSMSYARNSAWLHLAAHASPC